MKISVNEMVKKFKATPSKVIGITAVMITCLVISGCCSTQPEPTAHLNQRQTNIVYRPGEIETYLCRRTFIEREDFPDQIGLNLMNSSRMIAVRDFTEGSLASLINPDTVYMDGWGATFADLSIELPDPDLHDWYPRSTMRASAEITRHLRSHKPFYLHITDDRFASEFDCWGSHVSFAMHDYEILKVAIRYMEAGPLPLLMPNMNMSEKGGPIVFRDVTARIITDIEIMKLDLPDSVIVYKPFE